jgi:hypothetical protein
MNGVHSTKITAEAPLQPSPITATMLATRRAVTQDAPPGQIND